MHARFYSANMSRFLSVDSGPSTPSQPQSWNRYTYALNSPAVYIDPDGQQVRTPVQDLRTFLLTYRLLKTVRNELRVKGPNISGNTVGKLTSTGIKGWNYFSMSASDALDNREVLALTGQYRGLGLSVSIDFESLDRSSFSLIALIFQKGFAGDRDMISVGFGKLVGGEMNVPIEPLTMELVNSLTEDDASLILDALTQNPELEKGLNFLNGVLVYVK